MDIFARLSPHVHWLPRSSMAASICYHGIEKFDYVAVSQESGIPEPVILLVAVIEVSVAIAWIIGGFGKLMVTRVTAVVTVILMNIAIPMHWPNGWNMMNQGYEFQVLVLVTGIYFLIRGNNV